MVDFQEVEGPDTAGGKNLASIVYTVLSELDIGAKLLQLLGTMPIIIQQWQKFFLVCLKPILIRRYSHQATPSLL